MAFTGCNVAAAAECASTHAADALGLISKGRLEPGYDADFLFLDPKTFDLRQTWICGNRVWAAAELRRDKAEPLMDLAGTTITPGVICESPVLLGRVRPRGEMVSAKFGIDASHRANTDESVKFVMEASPRATADE